MVNSHPDLLPVSRSLPSTACHHDYLAHPRISCKWSRHHVHLVVWHHHVTQLSLSEVPAVVGGPLPYGCQPPPYGCHSPELSSDGQRAELCFG